MMDSSLSPISALLDDVQQRVTAKMDKREKGWHGWWWFLALFCSAPILIDKEGPLS